MNLDHLQYCEIGNYDHQKLPANGISSPLNLTTAIVQSFNHLFDFNLTNNLSPDLIKIRFLLCYRAEVISFLFIIFFLSQSVCIYIIRHLAALFVRQRSGSYIQKKKGVYTLDSHIFNSFGRNTCGKDSETCDGTFYVRASKFVFFKKCFIALLILTHLVEIYCNVHSLPGSQGANLFTATAQLAFSFPILSCLIRLCALVLIGFHLFGQTQPPEKVVLNCESLSPSIYSRANQAMISLFWIFIVLNTLLSIHLFGVSFTVDLSGHANLKQQSNLTIDKSNSTFLKISPLEACSYCEWKTVSPLDTLLYPRMHLPKASTDHLSNLTEWTDHESKSHSLAIHYSLANFANQSDLTFHFLFEWLYFCMFLAQLLLAFCPDFVVKSRSNSEASTDGLFNLDIIPKSGIKKSRLDINPEDKATFLSKLTFTWFDWIIFNGYKSPLQHNDIFPPSWSNRVEVFAKRFFALIKHKSKPPFEYSTGFGQFDKFHLITLLVRQFGLEYVQIASIKLVPTLLTFLSPILLDRLIQFAKNDEPFWHGYVYVAAMFFLPLVESILNSMSDYRLNILALKLRSCLTASIYERMLRCRSWSISGSRFTSGQLVNLMSIDTQRVLEYVKTVNLFWICPLQIAIAIYMLWSHLGYGSLAGLAVLLLLLPFNAYIGTRLRSLQAKLLEFKDQRIKVLNETIASIRAIKLYAWEEIFQQRILCWRHKEVENLRRQTYYSTAITFAFNSAPFLVAFASFTLYLLLNENNRLDAQKIFVSLAIFNIIRRPLAFFPQLITNSMMFMVSMKRIGDFFDFIEDSSSQPIEILPRRYSQKSIVASIEIIDCSFSWSSNKNPTSLSGAFQLSNISLQLNEPTLCAIIGEIGSGKSSLLSAVLGQMSLVHTDKYNVFGSIAYVPQNAWIQSGTVRDNILFGKKFDRKWYQRVVEACALDIDFQQMTNGDQMLVGQKGFSLSGGQKQRISIARAVYSNADLYLFDDPLSALDSQVSKHVFTRVLGSAGLLSGKIRLLVTHNMAILPRVDQIMLLKNGSIAASGSFRELMDEENAFTDFLAGFLSEPSSAPSPTRTDLSESILPEEIQVEPEDQEVLQEMANRLEKQFCSFTRRGSVRRQFSCQSPNEPKLISFTCMSSPKVNSLPPEYPVEKMSSRSEIVSHDSSDQMESTKTGSVSCAVYLKYIFRVGMGTSAAIVIIFFLGHLFMLLGQLWLSTFSSDHNKSNSSLRPLYVALNSSSLSKTSLNMSLLGVYGLFGLVQTAFILVGTLLLYVGCLRASRHVHNQMLTRLMTVPIWFFDATSSSTGQILNRFTKDVDIADTVLISNFLKLIIELFRTIASFCPIILGTDPKIVLFFFPMTFLYYFIFKYCIATSRQLIRLEASLRTPIYSYFTETYSGVSLIQAFGAEQRFIVRNYRNIDKNATAFHMSIAASRWLTIRLDLLGNLVVLSTSMFCVLKRGDIDSGMVGLCMSCAYIITSSLNMLIRSFTDLESNIVSVERLLEFSDLPQEASRYLTESEKKQLIASTVDKHLINSLFSNCVPLCGNSLCKTEEGLIQPSPALSNRTIAPCGQWLQCGLITICQYYARYRHNLDYCLRDLNFSVGHGQKVAIVGRTGAGKSSFALSLFRLIEPDSGCIFIGGRNIQELGLHELRSTLTIIPQDSLLFSGTLRENMDPLNLYTDEQLLIALAKVNLTDLLLRLCPGHKLFAALDQQLDETRLQALSAGQKQLLCLARVLLRQPKVLILDEATAAIDPATDELVQETIFREFVDCTVLSIVHRLQTVLRYPFDRVLVLEGGKVAEFDSPHHLMAKPESLFYAMLQNRL